MSNTRDLRRRIKSVKNTSQITKAMQMVSATKMRKAQNQALLARPYSHLLAHALKLITKDPQKYSHPLLEKREGKRIGVVLFSTDKGLCGALNTNLFRFIQTNESFKQNVSFYSVGKKGRDFLVRTGRDLKGDFENHEHVHFSHALIVRKLLVAEFKAGNIDEVYLLYPDFVTTLRQEPKLVKILPIEIESLKHLTMGFEDQEEKNSSDSEDLLFEPDLNLLLDFSLTHFVDIQIYKAYLETRACEHSARMIAMQNATDNAKDLVQDLTLTYNQVRQENITRELLEIISAGAALE